MWTTRQDSAAQADQAKHCYMICEISMTESSSDSNLVITGAVETFAGQKELADRAIAQLADDQLHRSLDPETNCVAVIMQHIAGNMRSRWTEFLASDGEKPWRNRDSEFVDEKLSREELQRIWERGWKCLFDALAQLSDDDLGKEVRSRGKPHTVVRAIDRQIDHYGYHIGQIVLVARILAQDNWTPLSIPRGESEAYNRRTWQT